MAQRKIIAVVGATGAQGGGLVRAILADPGGGFAARAITRDVNSDKAKALAATRARKWSPPTSTTRRASRARSRAPTAPICVTFYWAHFKPEQEYAEARNMASAVKAAGVSHVIWSTLEDTRTIVPPDSMPTLMGKYKVPHFDAKGEADQFFRDAGIATTYPVPVVLLGQPHLLRRGTDEGTRRRAAVHACRPATRRWPGLPRKTSVAWLTASSRRAASTRARKWAWRASN